MDVSQRFCVRWNSYKTNLQTAFPKLLTSEHFVDVTLACEKQYLKCHKIVLSACSVYFEDLLVNNPCQHPIIFMKDVAFWEMKALVEFMYKGEVNVSQEQLDSLLKSAESLQIRGLSGAKKWMSPEPEETKKKRRRHGDDEDGKSVQITSCDGREDDDEGSEQENKNSETLHDIKEEILNDVEDPAYLENTDDEETQNYHSDEVYNEPNRDPGPSNMSESISSENSGERKSADGENGINERRSSRSRRSCYKQYTMSSMWAALERIEQGLSVYRASIEYGVPRKTLRNWMKKYNILSYFDLRKQHRLKTNYS